MNKKCLGCGAYLQYDDKNKIGYVSLKSINNSNYCERCFKLTNYGQLNKLDYNEDDYIKIYKNINKTNDLVLFLVDIFNINSSISMINKYINNKIILVITKYDIISKNLKDVKLLENIKKYNFNNNIVDIVLISSKKNYNIELLYNKIIKNKIDNKVYVCGNTNSGKSTLINRFIKNYSNETLKITTSHMPNTTINTNEIYINEELTFIDTPGFIEKDNIYEYVDSKLLKKIIPNKQIRPITYQIKEGTTLLIDNLLRIEYVKGEKNSFTFYISNDIIINRINTMTNKRGKNLKLTKVCTSGNEDVIVNGLCFIKVKKEAIINIYTLENVGIHKRKSLI